MCASIMKVQSVPRCAALCLLTLQQGKHQARFRTALRGSRSANSFVVVVLENTVKLKPVQNELSSGEERKLALLIALF